MSESTRRGATVALGFVVTAVVVLVAIAAFGGGGGRTAQAEFQNVRGLLVRNEVLVNGAKAGTVSSIKLTRSGTALVTVHLDSNVPLPRSDAAASVRPVDLLGDIYLSYSPGTSSQPMRGPIPVSRTENVPRLSDLLRAFTPGARTGAQALIVELAAGLEQRGVDLNRAAVELRPALVATDQVTGELSSQNATLRSLISNSSRLVSQLAARNPDLSRMVQSFASTLRSTAAHAPALDRGLARLAPTVAQIETTTGNLAGTANALRPVATQLGATAPALTDTMRKLSPFLTQAQSAVSATRPALRAATTFLADGTNTFNALRGGLASARDAAPQSSSLLSTLTAITPLISDALFQNVASETAEPGNQPLDPTDPLRNYWRGAAVLSCQTFGLAIGPGCLQRYLSGMARHRRSSGKRAPKTHAPASRGPGRPDDQSSAGGGAGGQATPGPASNVPQPVQALLEPLQKLTQGVGALTQNLTQGGGASGSGASGSSDSGAPGGNGLKKLLNYLLGP